MLHPKNNFDDKEFHSFSKILIKLCKGLNFPFSEDFIRKLVFELNENWHIPDEAIVLMEEIKSIIDSTEEIGGQTLLNNGAKRFHSIYNKYQEIQRNSEWNIWDRMWTFDEYRIKVLLIFLGENLWNKKILEIADTIWRVSEDTKKVITK